MTDGATIKILHSGKNNPYLTKEIANKRGSHYDEWQVELSYAKKLVGILNQKSKTNIKALQHNEGYYWRMFIFESVAFVQPYLYISNNSEQAPVIKVNKYLSKDERLTNQNSLYVLFSKYFDDKWQAYKNA